jgi:membrane fusion protein, multidrug efflux system
MTSNLNRSVAPAGLILALALLVSGCGNSEAKNPIVIEIPKPAAVTTVAAEARALPGDLDVTGTLQADAQTEVASEGSGRVLAVNVERGTVVKAGAVLARIDAEDARSALREMEAMAAQTQARLGLSATEAFDAMRTAEARKARASMERAELEYQRYAKLVEMGAVSRSDYDLRRMEATTARELYESSLNESRQLYQSLLAQRARVDIARRALADTNVRAPYDGLVAEKHATVGQYLQKGARVATLVRVDPLRVELIVPEAAVAVVRRGQKVSFGVQAYPDRRFDGVIAYVGPSVKADSRALVVEALVPNPDGRLQPGLFATARIELPAGKPSVLVPTAAVRTEAGVSKLWVVKQDRAEMRLVQLGREVGDRVEALRGVAPGEQVVAAYSDSLQDGAPVSASPATGTGRR